MKRVMVVVAIVMVLTLALSAGTANAQPGWGGNGGGQQVYIVRPGDTLSSISFRFGVSMFELGRVNGIMNPNLIFSGMCLTIPVRYAPMPRPIYNSGYCQPQCDYGQSQCNYGCDGGYGNNWGWGSQVGWNECGNGCWGGGYYGNNWGSQVGWYGGGYGGCSECDRPQVAVPYAREGFGRKG